MSFRNRLTFFFILLVILPVLAVASVGILIVRDSEERKNDAGARAGAARGGGAVPRRRASARRSSRETVGTDDRARDRRARRRPGGAAGAAEDLAAARRRGAGPAHARRARSPSRPASGEAVAPARSRVVDADGRPRGRDGPLGDARPRTFADLLARRDRARRRAHAGRPDRRRHAGGRHRRAGCRCSGEAEIDGEQYRVTGFETPAFDGGDAGRPRAGPRGRAAGRDLREHARHLPASCSRSSSARSRSRSPPRARCRLQTSAAARRRRSTSARATSPSRSRPRATTSSPRSARSSTRWRASSRARLEELQLERARLQETVRRVGESLGKGLDRDALLGIVVQTAVDGVGGRVRARGDAPTASTGRCPRPRAPATSPRTWRRSRRRRRRRCEAGEAAETQIDGANALARPLPAPEPEDGRARRDLDRPPRAAVLRAPARAVRLPHEPGRDLDRERRPARGDPAPGGHGRADRAVQPPPLPGGHGRRGRAHPALRAGAGPDHARHRQLQARQRHLRPPPGRLGPARGRARAARVLARDRRAGPLRRRGDGRGAAADRAAGRVRVRRARAPADRGARDCRCWTARGRCG